MSVLGAYAACPAYTYVPRKTLSEDRATNVLLLPPISNYSQGILIYKTMSIVNSVSRTAEYKYS